MSNITPTSPPPITMPAIPAHVWQCLRTQQEGDDAASDHDTFIGQAELLLPDMQTPSDPLTGSPGALNFTHPPLIALKLNKPTLLDFFNPAGIIPTYESLLAAMDYVCATSVWVDLEEFLLGKGFDLVFWTVVGANTNQTLGLRRAELLETMTKGRVNSDMIGEVVTNWDFVWRLAAWIADGGEWEDVGPVRELLEC
ncbi:hypothetical protein EDC01DRAFT_781365 [Geopyxis carbonaria]|nr:hypothetical protein EDC01DRAFT_781365 [Geopyxis carbonaria]